MVDWSGLAASSFRSQRKMSCNTRWNLQFDGTTAAAFMPCSSISNSKNCIFSSRHSHMSAVWFPIFNFSVPRCCVILIRQSEYLQRLIESQQHSRRRTMDHGQRRRTCPFIYNVQLLMDYFCNSSFHYTSTARTARMMEKQTIRYRSVVIFVSLLSSVGVFVKLACCHIDTRHHFHITPKRRPSHFALLIS